MADALTDAMVFVAIFVGLGVREVLPPWLPALIAAREVAMHGLIRPTLLRMRIDAGARPVGKLKTVLQAGAAIMVLLMLLVEPELARRVAVPLVGAAAVLSVVSLYWYVDPIGERRGWDRLTLSIVATCLSLWLLQIAIVWIAADLDVTAGAIPYALLHTVVAGGLIFLLLRCRGDFELLDGEALLRINPSNVLTLARLTSIPTLVMLMIAAAERTAPMWPALALLSVVLLTDVADGALARRRGQVTSIGAHLDSSTDYLLLGTASILLLIYGIGMRWAFVALVGRLAIQSAIVFWLVSAGRPLPSTTRLGKASIVAGMVLLAAALGAQVMPSSGILLGVLRTLDIALVGVLAISAVEKLVLFMRTGKVSRDSQETHVTGTKRLDAFVLRGVDSCDAAGHR